MPKDYDDEYLDKPARLKKQFRQEQRQAGKKVLRFYVVFFLFVVAGLAMVGKLFYVQVWDSGHLKHQAHRSRNQTASLFNRGRILDRNGKILAQDSLLYDIFAHPKYYWKASPQQIGNTLAPILSTPAQEMTLRLSRMNLSTIRVGTNIPKTVVDRILEARISLPMQDSKTGEVILDEDGNPRIKKIPIPGLDYTKKTVRNYPQGALAAHLLGYVNDGADIATGVEETAKKILKKEPASLVQAELDGRGRMLQLERFNPESLVDIPEAEDVTLTLDARLQYVAERELEAGVLKSKGKRGAAVVMNPKNGEVLAFAVYPNYRPDEFWKYPQDVLKNWATTDVYPPGSTFKILTVTCGLETGVINRHSTLLDTGRIKIGGWNIENYDYYKRPYPGTIGLIYLLQHSSNIGSAKIAMMMKPEKYHDLLNRFGIGSKTGIDVPGESSGILPDYHQWKQVDQATMGYGYGIASTPIQMAAAVAAIANGGVWNQPHVIKTGHQPVKRRVISAQTAQTVTELLAESIETAGTSTVRLENVRVAGKTGTSRKPAENGRGYSNDRFTSFVGYFPAEDPEVLVMVVVDSPRIGEAWGSTVAGPIFHGIAEEAVHYLGLAPAKTAVQKGVQFGIKRISNPRAGRPIVLAPPTTDNTDNTETATAPRPPNQPKPTTTVTSPPVPSEVRH